MLREDMNGDFIGEFVFEGQAYEYRIRGYGRPVLITASISSRYGSYAWRYIFECLSGAYFVYSLDVEGMIREDRLSGPRMYEKIVAEFIRKVIGARSFILSGTKEYQVARLASREARAIVDHLIVLCPAGVGEFGLQGSYVARAVVDMVQVPVIGRLRKSTAGAGICRERLLHSNAPPGGKSPLRICEDLMQLLR